MLEKENKVKMSKKELNQLTKYGVGVDMGKKYFHVCIKSEYQDGDRKVEATKRFFVNGLKNVGRIRLFLIKY